MVGSVYVHITLLIIRKEDLNFIIFVYNLYIAIVILSNEIAHPNMLNMNSDSFIFSEPPPPPPAPPPM